MKRREVDISQKDGRFQVLLAREPLPLDLAEVAREANYQMPAICERIGTSERHLRRLFMEGLGIAPKDWLKQQRMVAARYMLRSGASVKEVAFDLGFTNAKMLSRDFVEFYGVRPTEFQRKEAERIHNSL
jgi:AraC family transcriptional regulator of adaptative response / DNA-3-methyladenine glycosylase II